MPIYENNNSHFLLLQHNIDGVIHLAALKAVGESCREPLMYYANNVTGSANLLQVRLIKLQLIYIKTHFLSFLFTSFKYGNTFLTFFSIKR